MRKNLAFTICLLFLFACDTENAPDCFQRTGTIVRKQVEVPDFDRILVLPNIELVIKQEDSISVVIESGDNLINEVTAKVEDGRLILENTNDCNFVRSFNQTKIFVSAPNIVDIRSATQYDISSDGVLTYPILVLRSEDFIENNEGNTTGTFHIKVTNDKLTTVGNNIASFFIQGTTDVLSVVQASGTGRFEGANLIAKEVKVRHRGTNKIIVNPQESITGTILSTGDVIVVNRPTIVDVEEFFTGKLIFQ